jgi:hypothetical protein
MNLRRCENLEYDRVNKLLAKLQVDLLAQLYPQAPGSLFVALYGSQGYGGVILVNNYPGENLRAEEKSVTMAHHSKQDWTYNGCVKVVLVAN